MCTTPPGPYEECYVETDHYVVRDLCDGTTDVRGYRIGIYQYRNGSFGDYCLGPTPELTEPLERFPSEIECTSGDLCIGAIFYEARVSKNTSLRRM